MNRSTMDEPWNDEATAGEGSWLRALTSSSRQRVEQGGETSGRMAATGLAAPIVFDFDDDKSGLTPLSDSAARFDMNGDGILDETGWIARGDAFLALDRNDNGRIDGLSEISFIADKPGAKTDLEGLAAFDSNADRILDGTDEQFVKFRLWLDRNVDGKTDAGELLSLAEAGIASISLDGTPTGNSAESGDNLVYATGTATLSNGASRTFLDAGLAYRLLAEVPFRTSHWEQRGKNLRVASRGGELYMTPRSPQGVVDSRAGGLGPASLSTFQDGSIGLLSAILIDLDGDGLEAGRYDRMEALFDMDGDGVVDDTGWVRGGDGLLVLDRDGDGRISTPAELSFLAEKPDAKTSWEALRELDQNKDGQIDKADARFADLRIWVDANANGVSEDGELRSLSAMDIKQIGLSTNSVDSVAKVGWNVPLVTALFTRDSGMTATIGSVAFAFKPAQQPGGPDYGRTGAVEDAGSSESAARLVEAISRFGVRSQGEDRLLHQNGQDSARDWIAAGEAQ